VAFRSSRESIAGRVYLRGRAGVRETLTRVGSLRVYRRDAIRFPLARRQWDALDTPFTGPLQGIHTRVERGRIAEARVVTR
jgi:hypothetical protein